MVKNSKYCAMGRKKYELISDHFVIIISVTFVPLCLTKCYVPDDDRAHGQCRGNL